MPTDQNRNTGERKSVTPLFLPSPSSTPPLCVDAQKVELQGSQLGESQVTRFKEIRLNDHPASAVPNAGVFLASVAGPLTPVHANSFMETYSQLHRPPLPSRQHLFVTQHEDNAPIHAGASFNVENVHSDAFNARNTLRSLQFEHGEYFLHEEVHTAQENYTPGSHFTRKLIIQPPNPQRRHSYPFRHTYLLSNRWRWPFPTTRNSLPVSICMTTRHPFSKSYTASLLHLKSRIQPPKFETTNRFYILNTKMELPGSFLHKHHLYLRISKRQHLSTLEHISYSYV